MCGRASLSKQEKELEERFHATFYKEDIARYNPLPNYNVAPTQWHPVITGDDPGHLVRFRWGLLPPWAKDERMASRMINARMETILEKPAFRQAFAKRRCLVPFDGFYEWAKGPDGRKTPYLIEVGDRRIFAIAGIWESWSGPDGEAIPTFCLITRPPNELMAGIHDRMPAILLPEDESAWLDPRLTSRDLLTLLEPYPSGDMHACQVSSRVNRVTENDPGLLTPITFPGNSRMGDLFQDTPMNTDT